MDYSKSGGIKADKYVRPHVEHNAKGTSKNPFGGRESKAEFLARMKAAAEAKKAGESAKDEE